MKYRENMTREEVAAFQAELDEFEKAYARADALETPRCENDEGERLDAYGHLNWTVGNEDWLACFDAVRVSGGIAYHVVVDCESGGFTDTIEQGLVDVEAAATLAGLPDRYADTCAEHYIDTPDMMPDAAETADCAKRWAEHLAELAAQPEPEPQEEPSDEDGELRRAGLDHREQP